MTTTTQQRITPTKGISSREAVIMQYYPLAERIACKMASRYPSHVDVNDLIQVGIVGLIEAVDRFCPHKNSKFEAYARIRIQGAILDNRRSQDWSPRSVRQRARLLNKTQVRLRAQLNRRPTNQELAGALDVSLKKLDKMVKNSQVKSVLQLDQPNEDNSLRLIDTIADQKISVREKLEINETKKKLIQNIAQLSEREKKLVELHYYQGCSFQSIGKELGVSPARISQLHANIKSKLKTKMVA